MRRAQCCLLSTAFVGFSLITLLSGCASDAVNGSNALRDTWSTQLEQYGIWAVFPPRADIQVGDIYLSCVSSIQVKDSNKDKRRLTPTPLWVASVPEMLDDGKSHTGYLSREYLTRLQLPRIAMPSSDANAAASAPAAANAVSMADTKKPVNTTKTSAVARAAIAASGAIETATTVPSIFRSRPLITMMPVSMPEFFSASATQAQASAIIPLPTIMANLGVSASSVDSVQISVPSAESYGLPVSTMLGALNKWKRNGRDDISNIDLVVAQLEKTEGAEYCPIGKPKLVVVSEIYATRSIDVSMSFKGSVGVGGGIGLNLPDGSKNKAVWDALSKFFTPQSGGTSSGTDMNTSGSDLGNSNSGGTAPTTTTMPTIDQATQFVKELDALYSKLGGNQKLSYPGVEVTVVSSNSSGITMNRKFEVPVVIGYRGFSISLNALTNNGVQALVVELLAPPDSEGNSTAGVPAAPALVAAAVDAPRSFQKKLLDEVNSKMKSTEKVK